MVVPEKREVLIRLARSSLVHTKENQEEFLRRFQEADFVVERAAELVGVTKQCVYKWKKEYPEFGAVMESLQETGNEAKTERIEQNIAKWAENPTEKVGMVNFLAAMAWLKAHKPGKWNEKIRHESKKEVQIVKIEYALSPGRQIKTVSASEVKELSSGYTD